MTPIAPDRLLDCIRAVPPFERPRYRPFLCQGRRLGWIIPEFAAELALSALGKSIL